MEKYIYNKDFYNKKHGLVTRGINMKQGFTLIELLVVISIIALLSSTVLATLSKGRMKARDSTRIQNARQIAVALGQYELAQNTWAVANGGYQNNGYGYVSKGPTDDANYTTASILSVLKTNQYYSGTVIRDPTYGLNNYYLGVCTTTPGYTIFLKVEQTELVMPSVALNAACDGPTAVSAGFNYIGIWYR